MKRMTPWFKRVRRYTGFVRLNESPQNIRCDQYVLIPFPQPAVLVPGVPCKHVRTQETTGGLICLDCGQWVPPLQWGRG